VPIDPDLPFRDAEAWLAERGVRREPIRLTPAPDETPGDGARAPAAGPPPDGTATSAGAPDGVATAPADAPPLSAREAGQLARQAAADTAQRRADATAAPSPDRRHLEDDVAEAVAFIRRSTSSAPQTEGRLRAKLAARGTPAVVIDQALARARDERLVDDAAMAAAFVDERRRKGHAPTRIRQDLATRGFDPDTIAAALAPRADEDLEAAAFAVARDRAASLTGLPTETAFRRVVGHLARRGYPEALARKVARQAVFRSRDEQRTAGH
jgi:regulatory protein